MDESIEDKVVDFYDDLFGAVFSDRPRSQVPNRVKRDAVMRQIMNCAGAASQTTTRLFDIQRLSLKEVARVLQGLAPLGQAVQYEDVINPNVSVEGLAQEMLDNVPCPKTVTKAKQAAVYRIVLTQAVQALCLVGPLVAEWERAGFSTEFQLGQRVVKELNKITERLVQQRPADFEEPDARYEAQYRDYLQQRFFQLEAGTLRMTTNQGVDLRALFVMPHLCPRPVLRGDEGEDPEAGLMKLAIARKIFRRSGLGEDANEEQDKPQKAPPTALDQIKRYPMNVVIGAPGSGKSTLLEWLQLKTASIEEPFPLAGEQAIPVLLRVRELDPRKLPIGRAIVEQATRSAAQTQLMPKGWMERQMAAGRVLFMLDGLDEVEPGDRDTYVIPWLVKLVRQYGKCHYVVTSRPVGYPAGTLRALQFAECDLPDFEPEQVSEYTRKWCTALRVARNEPEEEAIAEGNQEGKEIAIGFKNHPYISNLARNPLMLSAICLLNYFEKGHLPEDRSKLYELCVEGLIHNWDQRRGIHSKYGLEEKIRVCREVALAMQAEDMAEWPDDRVLATFADVLGDRDRAADLLRHIRHRTGVLIERRPNVFAFAHLTFQEYLAARAVHEGNKLKITAQTLADGHADGRWQEVIALYCGLAPAPAAREMIENLMAQDDTLELAEVLAEAYLSSGPELAEDAPLRQALLHRIAPCPGRGPESPLGRFPANEVAPIANAIVGTVDLALARSLSSSFRWLIKHPKKVDWDRVFERAKSADPYQPFATCELIALLHWYGPDRLLRCAGELRHVYVAPGPQFNLEESYGCQAEVAAVVLPGTARRRATGVPSEAILEVLCAMSEHEAVPMTWHVARATKRLGRALPDAQLVNPERRAEMVGVARKLGRRAREIPRYRPGAVRDPEARHEAADALDEWADELEGQVEKKKRKTKQKKPGGAS